MKNKTSKQYIFGFVFAALGVLFGGQIAAAQTCDVTWRKIENPRVISSEITIPANQTVCVEPGVIVQFAAQGQIILRGRIVGAGTASERISITGQNVYPNLFDNFGTLDLRFADVGVQTNMSAGGSFFCRDCRFGARASITKFFNFLTAGTRFIWLENTVFDSNESVQSNNAQFYLSGVTAVLKNVTFANGTFFDVGNSYLYVDNVTSQNTQSAGLTFAQDALQPLFLDNLNITNSAGAGLQLRNGNYYVGENVTIQNAQYPAAGGGGFLPGSRIPASGNRNNWIEVGLNSGGRDTIYAAQNVPYVVSGFMNVGGVEFLPGARFLARPDFGFKTESGAGRLLGTPAAPIVFEPFVAGQKWTSGQFNSFGDRMEYVTLDGSRLGILNANFGGNTYHIDNSILRNHDTALTSPEFQFAFLAGNLFTNNGTGIRATNAGIRASGRANPNLFENNAVAVSANFGANPDVRYNWWNSPTGPTNPQNPGGAGDRIEGFAQFQPFRAARPDLSDRPPIVRMARVPYKAALGSYQGLLDARSRQLINWRAADDRQIVKQRVLFSPSGNLKENFSIVADNLPGAQTSFELNVPDAGFQNGGAPAFVRVVAVDEKGQEGWDEWQVLVPSGEIAGEINITSNVAGQTFRGGDRVPVRWTSTIPYGGNFQAFLLLDGDRKIISLGGGGATGAYQDAFIPFVSTDSARFAAVAYATTNRQKWFFSQPFSIRPDLRFADAPPTVALTSPTANQQIPAGAIVPIAWTAADDEALRQFDIQSSTDGGRTWMNVAENLPPTATNFNWQPNFPGALNDVRVRVIAVDQRFQNSSDGQTRVFRITAPTNVQPTVQVTFPANNASFTVGKSVFVQANASDSDGSIQRVEFYATIDHLGQQGLPSTTLIGSDATAPYQIGWNNLFAGNYIVTARAIDNRGGATVSAPVNVIFQTGSAPLPINVPELSEPRDGANFPANSNITLKATPGNGSRPLLRVEFYNGLELIGSDANAPYELVWNNVPAGRYAVFARAVADNGAESTSAPADISVGLAQQTSRASFDFDGDGKADISVFRPSNGVWYLNQSASGFAGIQFGLSSDKIVPADYDGDGKTDVAVYRGGTWYLQRTQAGLAGISFGAVDDIPVPADYDGDGKAEIAVFRPSNGVWYFYNLANNQINAIQFGQAGDKSVTADYDGDGKSDVAVFRNGVWYLQRSGLGFVGIAFGTSEDKPVPADYDGDGKSDIAVFRPSNGVWYLQQSTVGFTEIRFGLGTDAPVAADYDGDGKADVAVFRDGVWYLQRSQAGFAAVQFGASLDVPVPARR